MVLAKLSIQLLGCSEWLLGYPGMLFAIFLVTIEAICFAIVFCLVARVLLCGCQGLWMDAGVILVVVMWMSWDAVCYLC